MIVVIADSRTGYPLIQSDLKSLSSLVLSSSSEGISALCTISGRARNEEEQGFRHREASPSA